MTQYTIPKGSPITLERLGQILQTFQTADLPVLQRRYNYYLGKQDIKYQSTEYGESKVGKSRPDNRIVTNFVRNIIDCFEGFCTGKPVDYVAESDESDGLVDALNECFRYNDVNDEDAEFFRLGLIYGRGCEICYVDEDGKNRFRTLDPRTVIPVYSDDLNDELLAVIRFWKVHIAGEQFDRYTVEVYDDTYKTTYNSDMGFASFVQVEKVPHHFSQCPITIFKLNTEEEGIADDIFDLQNAYNTLFSSSVNDYQSFADAYLVLKGAIADEDNIASMKSNRVLMLDTGADAEYLTKDVTVSQVQDLLKRTEQKIREISGVPDFSSEEFSTSSGIAIKFRCMSLENRASAILNNFKKALMRRIELLSYVINLVSGSDVFAEVKIVFTRNLPVDLSENANLVNTLRGIVSESTLLSLLPFVDDVEKEIDKIKEEEEEKKSQYALQMETEFTDEEA